MPRKSKPIPEPKPQATADDAFVVRQSPDEDPGNAFAKALLAPGARHGLIAAAFANKIFPADFSDRAGLVGSRAMIDAEADKAAAGDLTMLSRIYASQAVTLDTMFTEYARRSAGNMGDYPDAAERYCRMALKAQANCRATLEALAKLHQPREQVVRHVYVGEGGQAVIADEFHHHGGQRNAEAGQPYEQHREGSSGPALPGQDEAGNGVPVPGDKGAEPLPAARGKVSRRTPRKPQRMEARGKVG